MGEPPGVSVSLYTLPPANQGSLPPLPKITTTDLQHLHLIKQLSELELQMSHLISFASSLIFFFSISAY